MFSLIDDLHFCPYYHRLHCFLVKKISHLDVLVPMYGFWNFMKIGAILSLGKRSKDKVAYICFVLS